MSIKQLKVVAFDWDNTLAMTRDALVFSINKVLPEYGLGDWEIVKNLRDRSLSFRDNFPRIFGNNADEAYEKYKVIYKSNYKKYVKKAEKTDEVLRFFSDNGIKCIIVSNKDRELLEYELPFLFEKKVFSKIVCGHEAIKDKPFLEQLIYAVNNFVDVISEDNVWMIGDSPMDSECALSAGAKAIRIGCPIWGIDKEKNQENITFFDNFNLFYNALMEK